MAKVGRNDPCPCGSGKKYKHCCLKKEKAVQSEVISLERTRENLLGKIMDFSYGSRFNSDAVSAFDLFWDGRYDLEEDLEYLSRAQFLRFIDWYIFDYQTSQSRKRIIELFAEEEGERLPPQERKLLEGWQDTFFSVYEVVNVEDMTVQLRDLFQDLEYTVKDVSASSLTEGSLLLTRLIRVGEDQRFSEEVTILPSFVKAELEAFAGKHFQAYQERHYGATWKDFLKDSGYLLNHFVMDRVEPPKPPPPRAAPQASEEEKVDEIVRQMQRQVIVGSLDEHYQKWLDTRIPSWGHKTPRQMVRTRAGQKQVLAVLDKLEEMEERRELLGQPYYDVERLRIMLGLSEE